MKIAYDAKRLFNNYTGLGNYSRSLVYNLQRDYPRHEYHLFTTQVQENAQTAPFIRNAYRLHLPSWGSKSYWRSFQIAKELSKSDIDIYHGLSHELPFGIQKTGVKSIVTIHDLVLKRYPDFFPLIDRTIYDFKFRYACQNADVVLAISESTKRDIIKYYEIPECKIKVIYQTCADQFKTKMSASVKKEILKKYNLPEDYYLYVGSVNQRKNLLGIVKALERLELQFRKPIVVVGDGGAYLKKVKEYILKHELTSWVIFPGKINFADLPAIYQSARLFIYPSFYEGFGIPVIEALYSGIPVITSEVSSLPEAGGPDAMYINPSDPSSIALAIERIMSDDVLYNEMVTKGEEYVQRFDQKHLNRQLMDLYEGLLGK